MLLAGKIFFGGGIDILYKRCYCITSVTKQMLRNECFAKIQRGIFMPPKPKFTKEQILDAALDIARTRGANAIVARDVGKRLGTSSSPIFTFWSNMDELLADVKTKAYEIFGQ